jgi:hypothetical protein
MGQASAEVVDGRFAVARAITAEHQLVAMLALLACATLATAQEPACRSVCAPTLLFEPTLTIEHPTGSRERVFEAIVALDVPTRFSRIGVALEAITAPFKRNDAGGRDNAVELESELNFTWLESTQTKGWVSSHIDVVDKFSPAERPSDLSAYTHKLNFELDTAVALFRRSRRLWWRDVEVEASLDYVATGLAKGANPWSLSFVLVIPLAGP